MSGKMAVGLISPYPFRLKVLARAYISRAFLLSGAVLSGCEEDCSRIKFATPVWEAAHSHDGRFSWGMSVIEAEDGDLLVAGATYGASNDVLLMRCDSGGAKRWSVAIGAEAEDEEAVKVLEVSDGLLVFGEQTALDEEEGDYYLVKTDSTGVVQWEQRFGGAGAEYAVDVVAVEGGFALLGTTESTGAGGGDLQLTRVNESGETLWSRTYGGASHDRAASLVATSDGGFALFGDTESFGMNDDEVAYYLVKTDEDGTEQWYKTYSPSLYNSAGAMRQTASGGYILAGSTGWAPSLVKTAADGSPVWHRVLDVDSHFPSVRQLAINSDGGYSLIGTGGGFCQYMQVVKTDNLGHVAWLKNFGGAASQGEGIIATQDGANVVVGNSYDYEAEPTLAAYIAKVSADGD